MKNTINAFSAKIRLKLAKMSTVLSLFVALLLIHFSTVIQAKYENCGLYNSDLQTICENSDSEEVTKSKIDVVADVTKSLNCKQNNYELLLAEVVRHCDTLCNYIDDKCGAFDNLKAIGRTRTESYYYRQHLFQTEIENEEHCRDDRYKYCREELGKNRAAAILYPFQESYNGSSTQTQIIQDRCLDPDSSKALGDACSSTFGWNLEYDTTHLTEAEKDIRKAKITKCKKIKLKMCDIFDWLGQDEAMRTMKRRYSLEMSGNNPVWNGTAQERLDWVIRSKHDRIPDCALHINTTEFPEFKEMLDFCQEWKLQIAEYVLERASFTEADGSVVTVDHRDFGKSRPVWEDRYPPSPFTYKRPVVKSEKTTTATTKMTTKATTVTTTTMETTTTLSFEDWWHDEALLNELGMSWVREEDRKKIARLVVPAEYACFDYQTCDVQPGGCTGGFVTITYVLKVTKFDDKPYSLCCRESSFKTFHQQLKCEEQEINIKEFKASNAAQNSTLISTVKDPVGNQTTNSDYNWLYKVEVCQVRSVYTDDCPFVPVDLMQFGTELSEDTDPNRRDTQSVMQWHILQEFGVSHDHYETILVGQKEGSSCFNTLNCTLVDWYCHASALSDKVHTFMLGFHAEAEKSICCKTDLIELAYCNDITFTTKPSDAQTLSGLKDYARLKYDLRYYALDQRTVWYDNLDNQLLQTIGPENNNERQARQCFVKKALGTCRMNTVPNSDSVTQSQTESVQTEITTEITPETEITTETTPEKETATEITPETEMTTEITPETEITQITTKSEANTADSTTTNQDQNYPRKSYLEQACENTNSNTLPTAFKWNSCLVMFYGSGGIKNASASTCNTVIKERNPDSQLQSGRLVVLPNQSIISDFADVMRAWSMATFKPLVGIHKSGENQWQWADGQIMNDSALWKTAPTNNDFCAYYDAGQIVAWPGFSCKNTGKAAVCQFKAAKGELETACNSINIVGMESKYAWNSCLVMMRGNTNGIRYPHITKKCASVNTKPHVNATGYSFGDGRLMKPQGIPKFEAILAEWGLPTDWQPWIGLFKKKDGSGQWSWRDHGGQTVSNTSALWGPLEDESYPTDECARYNPHNGTFIKYPCARFKLGVCQFFRVTKTAS